jgi:hypothetical protein
VGKAGILRAALVGAVLTGVVTSTGTNSASATGANTSVLPCILPTGGLSGHSGSIGNRQNGETICLTLGEKLLVSLSGPMQTGMAWQHIAASPTGILRALPLPITLARGVTAADFLAKGEGTVRLSSHRRACPPATPGSASCDALVAWNVTVTVHGPHRPVPQPVSPAA